MVGYLIMATQRDFWPFFTGCLVLAAGTAVFKPPVQGTFVKTLTAKSSGVGWGYFYMVVNIGGFLGPPLAHFLCGFSWPLVFYGCAALVSVNLLWLLSYPEVDSGTDRSSNFWGVAVATARNLLQIRLLIFILIASVFWAVLNQLWDMLPNFIVDWVDSASWPGISRVSCSPPEYVQRAATGPGMGDQSQPVTDNFPGGAAVLVR